MLRAILDVCGGQGYASIKRIKIFYWWPQWKTLNNNYTPEEIIAINEQPSLWKGLLPFRVYIPTKRVSEKLFVFYKKQRYLPFRVYIPTKRFGEKLFMVYTKQGICHDSLFVMMRRLNLWTVTRYSCVELMIGGIYISPVKIISYLQILFYH